MNRLLRKFSKRRRPTARRADFLTDFAEEEEDEELPIFDCTRPPILHFPPAPPPAKKKGAIMQKISTWSSWWKDHLPGRGKRDRRSESETRQPLAISGPLGSSTTQREARLFGHVDGLPALTGGLPNGEFRRRVIQTNPWFPPPADGPRTAIARASELLDASYSSSLSHLTRDESLRINTLAGSYSSGYASNNDSSPESSVHTPSWQPSAQLAAHGNLADKAVECRSLDFEQEMSGEHVYHELETSLLHRASAAASGEGDSCFSSEILGCSASSSADSSRAESPIYAIPYCSSADESRCASIEYVDDSDGYMELTRRCLPEPALVQPSPSFEFDHSGYACVRRLPPPPPQFNAPPPPSFSPNHRDCLELLDEQIAELKMKTEVVSRLVETAKERRELRDYARQMCFDHIDRLRKMRWFVENGFELNI